MPFITLTDTNDTPVWVRTETISTIGRHRDRTLVNSCAVRELPEQILELIADAESGGVEDEITDGVSVAEVRRALDTFFHGGPLNFENGGRVVARYCADMRAALEGFLKARRP